MIENLQTHRFQRDIERIVVVGPANVAVAIEAISTDLDCPDGDGTSGLGEAA